VVAWATGGPRIRFYRVRERAALRWIEAVTVVSNDHVLDEVSEDARRYFSKHPRLPLDGTEIVKRLYCDATFKRF
jgi:alkylhydroperoxidase family enzyme